MITNVALRARARRGLHWLVERKVIGDTELGNSINLKNINWTALEMEISKRCVLGQAVGTNDDFWSDGYFDTWSFVQDFYDLSDDATTDWMIAHGFDLKERIETQEPWDRLKAAWIDVAIENKLYKRPRKKGTA